MTFPACVSTFYLDMLLSYKDLRSLPQPNQSRKATLDGQPRGEFPFPVEPLANFIVPLYEGNSSSGYLAIIPAGSRGDAGFARYANQVRSFDWNDFYTNWNGDQFFEWFRREAEARFDVILIGSRTGVTEMGGVCSYQLADVVILFVAPNQQNIDGIVRIAQSLTDPKLIEEGRNDRPLSLIFVPSRIEHGEKTLLDNFERQFNHILKSFPTPQLTFEKSAFIDLKIPYVPYFAYTENVATREAGRASASDLVTAFRNLTLALVKLAPKNHPLRALLRDSQNASMQIEQVKAKPTQIQEATTNIFVCYAQKDVECVEEICQGLETKGYSVLREPDPLALETNLHPHARETIILGSAAIILVWSGHAAQSESVARYILFAQQLKKLILPVVLDRTSLPKTLIYDTSIIIQASCSDAVLQLKPYLPVPDSTDPLIRLSERATHEFIRIRKEAIDQGAEMLKRGEHREAVLAILEYLAHNDLIIGVREKAQKVLDADVKKDEPPPFRPDETRHIFGVRCKNGHVTYFDKRRVCALSSSSRSRETQPIKRLYRKALEGELDSERTRSTGEISQPMREPFHKTINKYLDEFSLYCDTCNEVVIVRIDCEDYK